jgi:hypothetical protein
MRLASGSILRAVVAVGCAAAAGGCWRERAAAPAAPGPGLSTPAAQPPPAHGIRFAPALAQRCSRSVADAFERLARDVTAGLPAHVAAAMVEATAASCRELRWEVATLECLDGATTSSEAGACMEGLSAEQQIDLRERFQRVLQLHQASSPPQP